MDFYTGRVLRVDLGRLEAVVEPLRQDWARLYLGGKGLLSATSSTSWRRGPTRCPPRIR